ncbi:TIM21-domain-containing protein [Flammula alnicola]|nr:TIM21-domain-containing protein [Flammula alnicola]
MSIHSVRLWAQTKCSARLLHCTAKKPVACVIGPTRKYATHRNSMDFGEQSKLLSESMDTRQRSEPKHDRSALRKEGPVKKWSELSTGGKVVRTTARTTNLGVILLGAGLSALLIYSLTSELFSKNSPTVLYGDACERIKQSSRIAKYLNGPLTFHNNPPSSVRPRHRNRHVISRVMVDSFGREHMIMTFYVQGRPEGEIVAHSEASYFETASAWVQDKGAVLSELSFDEAVAWSKDSAKNLWDKSIRAFKYLSGSPLPPPSLPTMSASETQETPKKEESSGWGFTGMFSSLKTSKKSTGSTTPGRIGGHFTEGEVHADLVKNEDGYFVFRYLLVDMPSSRDPNPVRVFVERQPGVRENESVMRWVS